jgi:hypothetical protein
LLTQERQPYGIQQMRRITDRFRHREFDGGFLRRRTQHHCPGCPARLGFKPTTPQQVAGILSEPAPSLPCARGTAPAATSAAAPPL